MSLTSSVMLRLDFIAAALLILNLDSIGKFCQVYELHVILTPNPIFWSSFTRMESTMSARLLPKWAIEVSACFHQIQHYFHLWDIYVSRNLARIVLLKLVHWRCVSNVFRRVEIRLACGSTLDSLLSQGRVRFPKDLDFFTKAAQLNISYFCLLVRFWSI